MKMIWLYRLLIFPALWCVMQILRVFVPKINNGFILRKRRPQNLPNGAIWIHASSGEFEYAKPLIRQIKQHSPNTPIVVSFFSPTYQNAILNTKEITSCFALPVDSYFQISNLLKNWNPQCFAIARTDLWPELLFQLRAKQVPITLFSMTWNEKKIGAQGIGKIISRWLLNQVDTLFCVSETDAAGLRNIGVKAPIMVSGDTRYDQVIFRLNQTRDLNENWRPRSAEMSIVCGSTWSEDEAVIIPAAAELLNYQFVIAPHEPTESHLLSLERLCHKHNLKSVRYSSTEYCDNWNVLIIDQVGLLADLYKWSHFAFIGGSFKKTVHSVMEALGSGSLTCFGPLHTNNREALQFKEMSRGRSLFWATEVQTSREMASWLKSSSQSSQLVSTCNELRAEVQRRSGASKRVAEFLITKKESH